MGLKMKIEINFSVDTTEDREEAEEIIEILKAIKRKLLNLDEENV